MQKNDTSTNLQELRNFIQRIINERDWNQFHSPKNMSINISLEANELLEKFVWLTNEESYQEVEKNRTEIEDELADTFLSILLFANLAKIDITTAFYNKVEKIKKRYPVELSKGNKEKYTKLRNGTKSKQLLS